MHTHVYMYIYAYMLPIHDKNTVIGLATSRIYEQSTFNIGFFPLMINCIKSIKCYVCRSFQNIFYIGIYSFQSGHVHS